MSSTNVQNYPVPIKRFQDHLSGKKGQILLGTFQSIVEKGIAKTTIRYIASKAGVNPGNIHYYFEGKTDLLNQVLEICYHNAITNMESIFNSSLSPSEKINCLFDLGLSLFKYRIDEWIVLASFWAHSMSGDHQTLKLHQKLNRRFQAAMIKILNKIINNSGSETSKDIAILMIGTMQGLAFQYVLDPRQFDPESAVSLLKKLIAQKL